MEQRENKVNESLDALYGSQDEKEHIPSILVEKKDQDGDRTFRMEVNLPTFNLPENMQKIKKFAIDTFAVLFILWLLAMFSIFIYKDLFTFWHKF